MCELTDCACSDCCITDEICGDINLCAKSTKVLWKSVGINAHATVNIKNTSDCIIKAIFHTASKEEKIVEFICPCEKLTLTIGCIKSLEIECCCCKNEKCTGCYNITLHYPSDFNNCQEKHCKDACSKEFTCWH